MRIIFALQACHSEDWVLDSQEIWAHWYYIWVVVLRKLNCVGFCGGFLLVGFDFFQIYHKLVKLIKSKLCPTHLGFCNEKCDVLSISACSETRIATKLWNSDFCFSGITWSFIMSLEYSGSYRLYLYCLSAQSDNSFVTQCKKYS